MGLIEDVGEGPVALDTAAFIYFIEENPSFLPHVDPIFEAIDAGRLVAVTSTLTLLEVLVVPYRANDRGLARRYEDILTRSRVRLVEIDRAQLRAAAQLRATHRGMRTPDALQVSAALSMASSVLVTNDKHLPEVGGLRVLQINDYVG